MVAGSLKTHGLRDSAGRAATTSQQAEAELDSSYSAQQYAYQEGQSQRFLQQQYQRMDAGHSLDEAPAVAEELQQAAEEALPDNEMTDYIQEEDEEEDPYYFVQAQQRPHGDIHQAARVGDTARVRSLVEEEAVDVNLRDTWDAVPLYYACLAGHNEVVQYLLEAGAVCNEYTFDGDRCHYAALTLGIRMLLRQFEARPPPLSPLATSLRGLSSLCDNPEATNGSQAEAPHCDFAFTINQDFIPLHRAIMAARSPYFRKMLSDQWQPLPDKPQSSRVVHLGDPALSPAALKAVLVFIYTERLDVSIEEVEPVLKVLRNCRLKRMVACVKKERRTLRYYFKSIRKGEAGPRRFVLQPGMLPEDARLAHDLLALRQWAAALEAAGNTQQASDLADVILLVQGHSFRCHKCILAARSDYFRAFLERSPAQPCSTSQTSTNVPSQAQPPATSCNSHSTLDPPAERHSTTTAAGLPDAVHVAVPAASQRISSADLHSLQLDARQQTSSAADARTDATNTQQHSPACTAHSKDGSDRQLPQLTVSDVSWEVFEHVLEFAYSGSLQLLLPRWVKAAGAELLFEAAERYLMPMLKREVAEHIVAALEAGGGSMDQLCRLLLAADGYSVVLLRNHCLAGLAQAFHSLERHTAREQATFEAFVHAVAPKGTIDILDGSSVTGASHGNIEGSGVGGLGIGTLLQDLREQYLELFGGTGKHRDAAAKQFDAQLRHLAASAAKPE